MADKVVLAGEGAIWAQPGGPNTPLIYLGCHELGDIEEPLGDVTLLWCSTTDPNRYEVIDSLQQTPGGVTTSMTMDVRKTADVMEKVTCPVPIYVNVVSCGKKNVFDNWDRSFVLERSWITRRVYSKLTSKDPETQDKASQVYDLTAEKLLRVFGFSVAALNVVETEDILDITFCNAERCAGGNCGDAQEACSVGFVGGGVLAGSPINRADTQYTTDGGATWTFNADRPFAAGYVISSVACFQKDKTTTRVIAARGTTIPGSPAQIAYSDNWGATWTQVDVGSVNGQYAVGPQSLFILDYFNIWLCTTGGYIYKSEDGGVTWTAQTSGEKTSQNLNAISFFGSNYGYCVGAANAILKTEDGEVWTALTGPSAQTGVAANTVAVQGRYRAFVGYADGDLYYTHNGVDFYERAYGGSGVGSLKCIEFSDEYFGVIVSNDGSGNGSIYATINGGMTWSTVATPTSNPNAGFNSVYICNPWKFYVAGDSYGGTGQILRVTGL